MTAMMFAGCLLLAFGPSAMLLLGYASRRSALLILTVCSAFFWLLAVFLSSLVWIAIPPLRTVHPFHQVVSVLIQEAVRFALVYTYVRGEKAADAMIQRGGPKLFNDFSAGIAAGLGYGTMHTVMMYGGLLGAANTEAAFYTAACPRISMFVWSAVVALLYNILHIALMVVAVDGYRRWSWPWMSTPLIVHLAFGLLTLLNTVQGGCIISLPVLAVVVAVAVGAAVAVERNPDYIGKRQQRAWDLLASAGGNVPMLGGAVPAAVTNPTRLLAVAGRPAPSDVAVGASSGVQMTSTSPARAGTSGLRNVAPR